MSIHWYFNIYKTFALFLLLLYNRIINAWSYQYQPEVTAMKFSKLSAPSKKEMFVNQFEEMILSGKLSIGEKLPTERELAEEMHVSRSIINGGIVELERKGFLEVIPRKGTFVADYRKKGNLEVLMSIMNYNGGHLRRSEIKAILEVRIALSNLLVSLLIPRITDEQIEELHGHVMGIKNANNPTEASNAAFAFQHGMAQLSDNTLIPLIFSSFEVAVLELWEHFCDLYGIEELYNNNYGLWKKISERDVEGAIQHIEESIGDSIHGSKQIYY